MNKIRITHVIPSFFPAIKYGGPNINLHYLSIEMSKYQIVKVFTTDKSLNSKYANKIINYNSNYSAIYCKLFNNKKSKVYFSFSFILKYLFNIKHTDIIHIHTLFQFPCFYALFCNFFFKKKLFISLRGTFSIKTLNSSFYRKVFKKIITIIFKIQKPTFLFTSNIELNEFKYVLNLKNFKYYILPNGTNLKIQSSNAKKFNKNFIRLIYFGRLDKKKNIIQVLNQMSGHKSLYLDIYSFNNDLKYFKKVKEKIKTLNLNERVFFKGSIQSKSFFFNDIHNYDFAIFLSESENFCNSALEAMMSGVPVILNKNIGITDYFEENKDYIMINKFNDFPEILYDLNNIKIKNIKKNMFLKLDRFLIKNIANEIIMLYGD